MATNIMDWDMEVDDHATVGNVAPIEPTDEEKAQIPAAYYESLVDEVDITLTKVYICGVDILTTKEIRAYVREHYGEAKKVEWIDDTSANLLFSSASDATDALNALAAVDILTEVNTTPETLFPAKSFTEKPEVTLHVRRCLVSDQKEAGAASRSRFYLLNPEYDPEERARRRETKEQQRRRERRTENYHRYHRNSYEDDDEIEKFNDNFYDDGEVVPPRRRHHERTYSRSRSRSQSHSQQLPQNSSKELFPERSSASNRRNRYEGLGRSRDRSASPMRDQDGDITLDSTSRRSNRDQDRERFIKHQQRLNNRAKELFPIKAIITEESSSHLDRLDASRRRDNRDKSQAYQGFAIKGAAKAESVKELFPSRLTGNTGKELFTEKLEGRDRRRGRAEDHW